MKKYLLLVLVLVIGTKLLNAQVSQDDYDKKVEEIGVLKAEKEKLEQEKGVLSIRISKLEEELKDVKEDDKSRREYKKEIKNLQEKLEGREGEIEELKKDNAKLSEEKKELVGKVGELESCEESQKQLEADIAALNETIKRLRKDSTNYESKLNVAEILKMIKQEKIDELNAAIDSMKAAHKTALEDKAKSLKAECTEQKKDLNEKIQTQTTTITNQNIEITNLKANSKGALDFSVKYMINSSDYDIAQSDRLISLCQGASGAADKATIDRWVLQLTDYKMLSQAVVKAQSTLASQYDKVSVNEALNALSASKALSTRQKEDVKLYKALLGSYCEQNNQAEAIYKKADIFRVDNQAKCRAILKEFLDITPRYYEYIHSELNKKVRSTTYHCRLKKESCN